MLPIVMSIDHFRDEPLQLNYPDLFPLQFRELNLSSLKQGYSHSQRPRTGSVYSSIIRRLPQTRCPGAEKLY